MIDELPIIFSIKCNYLYGKFDTVDTIWYNSPYLILLSCFILSHLHKPSWLTVYKQMFCMHWLYLKYSFLVGENVYFLISGCEIVPNWSANATKLSTLATKSLQLVAKLATRNMRFQKIFIPLPRREFEIRPHTSPEFPFFKNQNKPPPLRNFRKHSVHLPAPLEKFILKINCANFLNIRLLSLKNMIIDQS